MKKNQGRYWKKKDQNGLKKKGKGSKWIEKERKRI